MDIAGKCMAVIMVESALDMDMAGKCMAATADTMISERNTAEWVTVTVGAKGTAEAWARNMVVAGDRNMAEAGTDKLLVSHTLDYN